MKWRRIVNDSNDFYEVGIFQKKWIPNLFIYIFNITT